MSLFATLFDMLKETKNLHAHTKPFYQFNSEVCAKLISESGFASSDKVSVEFGPFGHLIFPYYSMGNIDSLKLFGLDELILFSFYYANRNRYKNVADMGANIGLHSILMSRLGWQVTAFEPDPIHVSKIAQNAALNNVSTIFLKEHAISNKNESLIFTRLIGNRTGSHIKGKKLEVYGEVEEFSVSCLAFQEQMSQFDFIKMDIEGAEADAICSTNHHNWCGTDIMLEVGSIENAERIYEHAQSIGVNAFSQKTGWKTVENIHHMPISYKEGSLLLTNRDSGWL
ncbi:FkbM family methyltransferase [Paraglaciecola sp. 25GB23A]|uniref:FkbM family methyltransferase n=1 Tax=Paraglaciecola sp. 25GB23A TaxID=3156068 RepID=UPI0032AF9F73